MDIVHHQDSKYQPAHTRETGNDSRHRYLPSPDLTLYLHQRRPF